MPETFPEKLDRAENGEQFGAVLNELFRALEQAKDEVVDDV